MEIKNNNTLWIYYNFKETADLLSKKEQKNFWYLVINYGFGDENIVENELKTTKKETKIAFLSIKNLLKLRKSGGSQNGKSNNPSGLSKDGLPNIGANEGANIIPTPLKEKRKEEKESKDNTTETQSLSFGYAWSIYPKRRRESKKDVYPVWCKVVKENNISEEELVRAVERYSTSEDATKDDGQYAKGFKAWLRGGCYAYEYKQIEQQPKVEEKPFNPAEHDFDMFGEKLWGDKKCTITE